MRTAFLPPEGFDRSELRNTTASASGSLEGAGVVVADAPWPAECCTGTAANSSANLWFSPAGYLAAEREMYSPGGSLALSMVGSQFSDGRAICRPTSLGCGAW